MRRTLMSLLLGLGVLTSAVQGGSVAVGAATAPHSSSPPAIAVLAPPANSSGAEFGYVTAAFGATIAVGAPYYPGGGRVFVYVHAKGRWHLVQVLKGADTRAGDVFGVDVKLSGAEMIVGADQASGTGRAYVFAARAGIWRQVSELPVSGLTPGDHYGLSVAISGANAIVSTEDDNEALLYHETGTTWTQSAKFTGTGEFGFWVGISGSTAAVGADEDGGGAIYVYQLRGSTWTQTANLVGTGVTSGDHFGQNLAVSGKTIVVNAPYHNRSRGVVYVYSEIAQGWKQTAVLGPGPKNGDVFGWYVAVQGATIVAGMSQWPIGGVGAAYVFQGAGAHWTQVALLKPRSGTSSDQFGDTVGVFGNTVVVGGCDLNGSGQADVYVL
jgi:FG-GAP repeat